MKIKTANSVTAKNHTVVAHKLHDGLPYVILRTSLGHLCGYVGILKDHPLYGVSYNESSEELKQALEAAKRGPVGKRGILSLVRAAAGALGATPENVFDVHGSLTFSGGSEYGHPRRLAFLREKIRSCSGSLFKDYYSRDLDRETSLAGQATNYPVPAKNTWWFGFDCAHLGDTPATCTSAYVEKECLSLICQLRGILPSVDAPEVKSR